MSNMLVLNFFPAFTPPGSGGELRYFHLYRELSRYHDVTLLSPTFPDHAEETVVHSASFREARVPKVAEIHDRLHSQVASEGVCPELSALVCSLSGYLPNRFHEKYLELYGNAEIIIHDSPFMLRYDLLFGLDEKPRFYNSYNVEYALLKQMYHGPAAASYLEYVYGQERRLIEGCAGVFAVSDDDRVLFVDTYGCPDSKISVVPNGIIPVELRHKPGIARERPSALFIGSSHPPNLEAVAFICGELAQRCPGVNFIIAGKCTEGFGPVPENVQLLGLVTEEVKQRLFAEADVAVNPMFSGGGSNLKTLEYLAMGIPLVSTACGVRGLGLIAGEHCHLAERDGFPDALMRAVSEYDVSVAMAQRSSAYVNEKYSWEGIARSMRDVMDGIVERCPRPLPLLVVLNDFPVDEPFGGGEIRINRLYNCLSAKFRVILVCLYRGDEVFIKQMGNRFIQVAFPKSLPHLLEEERANGLSAVSVNDIVTLSMGAGNALLEKFVIAISSSARFVVFCHVYMAFLLKKVAGRCPILYESLNYESDLKKRLLVGHPECDRLASLVFEAERELFRESDAVIAVSEKDYDDMCVSFGCSKHHVEIVRNGVDIKKDALRCRNTVSQAKPLVLFIGSGHVPNVTAARFIVQAIAPRLPGVPFGIIGSVCECMIDLPLPGNVTLYGRLPENEKNRLLASATVGLNPVIEGSGSNLKLAEYFSFGMAVVSTPFGVRGFSVRDGEELIIVEAADFPAAIMRLVGDSELAARIGRAGYDHVKRVLDWNHQAAVYHRFLRNIDPRMDGRPRLLFVTYRLTEPALGGAEVYLLNLLAGLDALERYAIDVVAPDVEDISNCFQFACKYGERTVDVARLEGMYSVGLRLFGIERVPDPDLLMGSREIYSSLQEEERRLSLDFRDSYKEPLLLGGWYFPETGEGGLRVWSSGRAFVHVDNSTAIRVTGLAPHASTYRFLQNGKVVASGKVSRTFNIRVTLDPDGGLVELDCETFEHPGDPRLLGLCIEKMVLEKNGRESVVDLECGFRDFLKRHDPERYIEALIANALSRPASTDERFLALRGPVSSEMEEWLERDISKYSLVVGQGVPFSTSVMAVKHATRQGVPVLVLPHYHMEDEFYHWKCFYEAFRACDAVLATPQASIKRFFDRIGAVSEYVLGGGIDPAEYDGQADEAVFAKLYGSSTPFFLVLGRKAGAKRYRIAMEAVQAVRRQGMACNLVMIGRDEDGVAVDTEGVFYLGMQPRKVVLAALGACAGLVSMSESESFGIVIVESWMKQKPVIVNRECASFVDMIEDGVDGILVGDTDGLADAMVHVLADPVAASRMGASGYHKATLEYTWKRLALQVASIVEIRCNR